MLDLVIAEEPLPEGKSWAGLRSTDALTVVVSGPALDTDPRGLLTDLFAALPGMDVAVKTLLAAPA